LKRLEALEAPRTKGPAQGVIVLPPVIPLDEWERLASHYQKALLESMALDGDEPAAMRGIDC
jgi:hypothetical protein